MFHPDYYILKGVHFIINGIKNLYDFCTLSIGGIPINAIAILFLLSITISHIYSQDCKDGGVISAKIKKSMVEGKGVKWLLIGAGGILAFILSL